MPAAGYKLFVTGDVLTAAQVNDYLMLQTVMVFANSAARTSALSGVLAEGLVSYLKDTDVVEIYTGAAWVSLDDPNAIQNSIVDAKGDLISATADNTPARLAVGTANQVLTVDSSTATGLKWATASSGALTLIKKATFSGAVNSGTTFDNVLSATYSNYIVSFNDITASTGTDDFRLQFRYAGPTTQAASYQTANSTQPWNSSAVFSGNNLAAFFLMQDKMAQCNGFFNISNVAAGEPTITGQWFSDYEEQSFAAGYQATSRTYTGFIISSSASNISGTVAIYGLAVA